MTWLPPLLALFLLLSPSLMLSAWLLVSWYKSSRPER